MSTFKGQNIFGSGPHRTTVGRQGVVVVPDAALGSPGPNSYPLGPQELDLTVSGRLVAPDEAGLNTLRDAVAAQLLNPPSPGAFIDNAGRSYPNMSFIAYEETAVARGRARSVAFAATFRRFNTPP